MAKMNISQAAKAVGKDRRTLQRHIKQGKLSCGVENNGSRLIDTSELIRVYGSISEHVAQDASRQGGQKSQHAAAIFEQKIRDLEQQVEDLRQDKQDWKQERNTLLGIVEKQTLLLEDRRERKGFWGRVFGR
jgi:predicted site-specific integrase-resolvase